MMSTRVFSHRNLSMRPQLSGIAVCLQITLLALTLASESAQAQSYVVLHYFTGGPDGGGPVAGLISDSAGNLYGTTMTGGSAGAGVVFKLDPTGKETVLYTFTGGTDGGLPTTGLVQDSVGNLYGTTGSGGACSFQPYTTNGCGVVFKLDPTTGQETVLYTFTAGSDGAGPGPLFLDNSGILYGMTTAAGGDASGNCGSGGCGVVFKLDPSTSTYTVLYTFTGGADGGQPSQWSGLIQDSAGNFYGTTSQGGLNTYVCGGIGCGVVFKLDSTGKETVLYTFTGQADGGTPMASLIRDAAGNFYGTTQNAGTFGWGVVFKLDPTGKETVLHEFTGGADGATPQGVLISDAAGNLYGTTYQGGTGTFFTNGVVFELNSGGGGAYNLLHTFAASGLEGMLPDAGLLMNSAGNLYGTTSQGGGSCSCGVVFEVIPALVTSFNLSVLSTGTGGGTVTSNPAGIDCGSTCSANFPNGTTVTLTATADSFSAFEAWSAPCSGSGVCTLATGAQVTATFNNVIPPDFSLTPASASLTLQPGGQGADVITIALQNNQLLGNPVQLSCAVSGPPPTPTCGLSPSSFTVAWTPITSTLTLTAPMAAAAQLPTRRSHFLRPIYALWLPLLFGISVIGESRKRAARYGMLCCFLLLVIVLQPACGSNASHGPTSYTVTIMGTSGSLQHTAQVTVTVQ